MVRHSLREVRLLLLMAKRLAWVPLDSQLPATAQRAQRLSMLSVRRQLQLPLQRPQIQRAQRRLERTPAWRLPQSDPALLRTGLQATWTAIAGSHGRSSVASFSTEISSVRFHGDPCVNVCSGGHLSMIARSIALRTYSVKVSRTPTIRVPFTAASTVRTLQLTQLTLLSARLLQITAPLAHHLKQRLRVLQVSPRTEHLLPRRLLLLQRRHLLRRKVQHRHRRQTSSRARHL